MLSEISQRKTNTVYDLTYIWNLKKQKKQKQNPNSSSSSLQREKMFIASAIIIMAATVTLLTPIKIIFSYNPRELLFLHCPYKTISPILHLYTSLFWTWIRFHIL